MRGDTLTREGKTGFETLRGFLNAHVGDAFSSVHILPMFPYTSDDGFSVVDYRRINPSLGTWEDVGLLAESYGLMTRLSIIYPKVPTGVNVISPYKEVVTALINVSGEHVPLGGGFTGYDLLSGREIGGETALEPYGCMWIVERN